jgi:predicted GIY-YIG superfamily endonuclease
MVTYLAINLVNKKFQVGSAKNFKRRQKQHLNGKGDLEFQRSLRKKPENFYWISSVDDGLETRDEEQYYLDFYCGSVWCYNHSPNADGGLCSTPEQLSKAGSISKDMRVGVHGATPEELSKWGVSGGSKSRDLGLGIHSLTKEERSENGRKTVEKGVGLFGRTEEQRKIDSSKAGRATRDKGTGWFGMTPEEKTDRSRKGASNTNSQVWQDPFDGYTGNAGNVARHMKINGRDPSNKRKVS